MDEDDRTMEELMAKKQHPQRLHPEMWFNDPGEVIYPFMYYKILKSINNALQNWIFFR